MKPSEYCRAGFAKRHVHVHHLCHASQQMVGQRTWRNAAERGRNERSGMKDTVAAVRNEEELQAV